MKPLIVRAPSQQKFAFRSLDLGSPVRLFQSLDSSRNTGGTHICEMQAATSPEIEITEDGSMGVKERASMGFVTSMA